MEKQNYILGLDLGVGSVGWSCMEIDKDNEPSRIIQTGSRIFPSENGDMESRRAARGLRRLIRRKKGRLNKVKSLFNEYKYLTREYIKVFFTEEAYKYNSPYELKVKGLQEKLNYDELFICLIHYAKYRGFKSNRKIKEDAKDTASASEEQKLLWSINLTQRALDEHQYTISQYILSDPKFHNKIKNTTNSFNIGITRQMIQNEVELLLDKQIELGVVDATFKEKYMNILLFQRSFSQGPDEPSPYHDPLKNMIGKCKFDGEDRAPLCAPTYEKFILLQKLSNIRFYNSNPRDSHKLTIEQIDMLLQRGLKNKITYKIVQEIIGERVNFIGLSLNRNDYKECAIESREHPEKELTEIYHEYKLKNEIYEMKMTKFIIKELKKAGYENVDYLVMDEIAELLSKYKSDDEIKNNIDTFEHLSKQDELFKFAVESIDESRFKEFGKLSFSVLYKILPEMEKGLDYSEAMQACGYDHTNVKVKEQEADELPPMFEAFEELDMVVTNKSVIATLQETKRLINAIISKFGKPHAIHVEVARELTKNDKEREQIINDQMMNKMNKIQIKMQMLNKYPHVFYSTKEIHHDDIMKYRLYHDQGGIDPYTLAVTDDESKSRIPEKDLFSNDYEVDHILPYSKSFNDTMSNKVLVSAKMNREKGDHVPMEVFGNGAGIEKYKSWVSSLHNTQKKEYLITSRITEEMIGDFSARALNDTRYATKSLCKILKYYFPNTTIKSFAGQITSKLKGVWGLNNLTHSYQSKDYRLKQEFDEELDALYKKLDSYVDDDFENKKVIDEIKKAIVKKEKERDKKNRANHLHHALDATIIACATDSLRRRVEIHEQYLRQKTKPIKTFRVNKYNSVTGEFLEYETKTMESTDKARYFDLTKNIDPKSFPLPYPEFANETILRIYERDENVLRDSLCSFGNYSLEQRNRVMPLMVSHKFTKKENGRLHKATILGAAPNPIDKNKIVLTNRVAIDSPSFNEKYLEKIYDKDGTQKQIYLAVKEWLGTYKDGAIAFAKNENIYPKSNNGNEIKKVKINFDEPKEEICIHEDKKQYVEKENVIQIHIYKKEGSDKLYFIGMDRYRVMNYKKDPSIILWWGQGKNCVALKYSELKTNGFVLYRKLYKNQIIEVELNVGNKGLCKVSGFSSGSFEVGSIIGDNLDIVYQGLQSKINNQQRITVSTIKSIDVLSINILGDFV
ncbi:type II CRISPR RNA-guided endonuclease Cas9 [Amedibacillus sp. YH-ame6]